MYQSMHFGTQMNAFKNFRGDKRLDLISVLGDSVFLLLLPRGHSQISKEAFSLQAFSSYQALYNTNLKVVCKHFRAIKHCLALAFLSLGIS